VVNEGELASCSIEIFRKSATFREGKVKATLNTPAKKLYELVCQLGVCSKDVMTEAGTYWRVEDREKVSYLSGYAAGLLEAAQKMNDLLLELHMVEEPIVMLKEEEND